MNISIINDPFMQHAILATLLAGVVCPLIGVLVVTMRLSFIGVSLAHAAFAGALLGLILGVNSAIMALIFSVIAAGILGPLADRGDFSPDTAMGVMFTSALGLSFLFLSLIPGPETEALGLLWGGVLTVTQTELGFLAGVTLVTLLTLLLFYKEVCAVLFQREIAESTGIPATTIFYGILLFCGLAITSSLNIIGGMLVFCLIINPAAAAYQLTYRLSTMFGLSVLIGVLSGWLGLIFSCIFNLPTGALIIVTSSAFFLVTITFSPKRKVHFQTIPKDGNYG